MDSTVKTIENLANARLPLAGGTLSGRLDAKTATMVVQTLAPISGTLAIDISTAQYIIFTLGANATISSFSNPPPANLAVGIILRITNGGSAVLTWPGSVKWVSGTTPTLTVAGIDMLAFLTDDGGTTWRGLVLGKDIR